MAGSYRHITDSNNKLILDHCLIENLGDAGEALEECYWMIYFLSGSNKKKIYRAWLKYIKKFNKEWLKENKKTDLHSYKRFWD